MGGSSRCKAETGLSPIASLRSQKFDSNRSSLKWQADYVRLSPDVSFVICCSLFAILANGPSVWKEKTFAREREKMILINSYIKDDG